MNKTNALAFVLLFCAGITFAQPHKGMMELALSGPVFENRSDDGSLIAPHGFLGYFINDKLELGGDLAFYSYSNNGDNNAGQIGIESAYHFSSKEKTWTYAGLGITSFWGDFYYDDPVQINGEIGVKFWPLPGGAVKLSGNIIQQISDESQTIFRIDVGILIRVK